MKRKYSTPVLQLIVLNFTFFLLFSCQREPSFDVTYFGELRKVMKSNDLSAHADLSDFAATANFYAIGALENLAGEITIINSEPYITTVHGEELDLHQNFEFGAAFLVSAQVKNWQSFEIPINIKNLEQLDAFIVNKAIEVGIDTAAPFPFKLEGMSDRFSWHVVHWDLLDSIHSHIKHVQSGLNGVWMDQVVEIIGFYSNKHHGIFTHHSSNMHMHVRTKNNEVIGHLDDLVLGANMKLYLPK